MRLYTKEELKDSRIFFDKNPPRFMSIFILFMVICISFGLFFSTKLNKSYVIVASGTATTSDNRYISMDANGEIIDILKKEGDSVKKDDVLFRISDGKENTQSKALEPQIKNLKAKLSALDIYEKSLNDRTNYLKNMGQEQAYYGKMEYFLSTIQSASFSKEQEIGKINETSNKLSQLKQERASMQNQYNALDSEEADTLKKGELKGKIQNKDSEIEAKQNDLSELTAQAKNPSSQADQINQQLFAELGADRSATTQQLAQLEGQMNASKSENELKSIKAENDGTIHYLITIKTGVAVQMNQTVAEISQNNNDSFIVEANIMAKDISKVKKGQTVNIELQGVNSQKYGTIKGKIEKISSGSFIEQSQQGNLIYYQCIISLESTELRASDGDTVSIIKSMPVQARIIYEKETYWDWLRQLINLKN